MKTKIKNKTNNNKKDNGRKKQWSTVQGTKYKLVHFSIKYIFTTNTCNTKRSIQLAIDKQENPPIMSLSSNKICHHCRYISLKLSNHPKGLKP